jgi:hypothetical protein
MTTLLELIPILAAAGIGAFSRSARVILRAIFHKPTQTTVVCMKADGTTEPVDFDGRQRDLSPEQIHRRIEHVQAGRCSSHSETPGDDEAADR